MALLSALRRAATSCNRNVLPFQARCQNAVAALEQFSGDELYGDTTDEELAAGGAHSTRTNTFVQEVRICYLPALHMDAWCLKTKVELLWDKLRSTCMLRS